MSCAIEKHSVVIPYRPDALHKHRSALTIGRLWNGIGQLACLSLAARGKTRLPQLSAPCDGRSHRELSIAQGRIVFSEKLAFAIRVLGCVVLATATDSLAGTTLADGAAASGTAHRCDPRNIVVRSPDYADVPMSCDGARDAIMFLGSQGLKVTSEVTIEIVPTLASQVGASAAGCYLEPERRVLMLSYFAFEKCGSWFNISAIRQLYRSFVTHEAAHALAACNFKIPKPSIQAKEYIAYVTMFAAMDPALRECVLSQSQAKAMKATGR